jgi:Zn-dependent M28 family amino/carboxypeptidase
MHRGQKIAVLLLMAFAAGAGAAEPPKFSGAAALEQTRKVVSFGPRPPGSAASRKVQAYVHEQLKSLGAQIQSYSFQTETPLGPKQMTNLIALFPGASRRAVVFSGHYDTKHLPDIRFVGANDGGSSTGFLLEMARVVSKMTRPKDVYLVWFDGEESFGEWTDEDSLYGSRHVAEKWAADGTLSKIDALINVDMIGDRQLNVLQDQGSSGALRRLIWDTARSLGYSQYFTSAFTAIGDDHVPFIKKGVNAVDVIDLDYPPWHTAEDTMDKLSANSFQIVGDVLVEVMRRLN